MPHRMTFGGLEGLRRKVRSKWIQAMPSLLLSQKLAGPEFLSQHPTFEEPFAQLQPAGGLQP